MGLHEEWRNEITKSKRKGRKLIFKEQKNRDLKYFDVIINFQ